MTKIAVVFHSGYGHTAKVAEAVLRGVQSVSGTESRLVPVGDVEQHWDYLDGADAIIFGAPTYMGSASAPMKAFIDSTSSRWMQQAWKDKIAAGFTNSASQSGDKLDTLVQFVVFASQMHMIWVGLDLLPGNNSSQGSTEDLNRIGSSTGLMTQSNADQGPDVAPPAGDLATAEHFGRRVSTATRQWVAGRNAL